MTEYSNPQQIQALTEAFAQAKQRLLMFDHDGVLPPLKNDTSPEASAPSPGLLKTMGQIANSPNTHLYVVSGRTKECLEGWYGSVPTIGLSAEHGAWRKINGEWYPQIEPFNSLKEQIVAALQPIVEHIPGSHIEVKDFAVVWHFRAASNQDQAMAAVPSAEALLADIVKGSDLGVYTSAITGKIIEVKPKSITKGAVASSLIEHYNTPDFIFAIGDDYTDEHAFAACPKGSWTVKVGPGDTSARLRLPDVAAVFDLLHKLDVTNK